MPQTLRTRHKTKTPFWIDPYRAEMTKSWTPSDFEAEMLMFLRRKDEIQALEKAHKQHRAQILAYMQKHGVRSAVFGGRCISVTRSTKKIFTPWVERELEKYYEKIDQMQRNAIANSEDPNYNGRITCEIRVVNEYNSLRVTTLENEE